MNLEELFGSQKDLVIFLIGTEGEVLQSYPEQNEYDAIQSKLSVFSKVVLNMSSDFFSNFFETNVQELMLKSDGKHLYLNKISGEQVLCFISAKAINSAILGLVIRKIK